MRGVSEGQRKEERLSQMEAITLGQLLEAVDGTPAGGLPRLRTRSSSRVDTDSRTIHPGSLFIPLVGERFDGHAYINAALEAGRCGLPHRPGTGELSARTEFYIKVASTQRALRDLAAWYKARFPIPFVRRDGQRGQDHHQGHDGRRAGRPGTGCSRPRATYNNNIGLPLTLLRLDRS